MRVTWDNIGERFFEAGCDHAVLYTKSGTDPYGKGTAWNGISKIDEKPTGGESTSVYADNIKYLGVRTIEGLDLSIEAYAYPDEFAKCDGSAKVLGGMRVRQQTRSTFGLCYRTLIGNDLEGTDHAYVLHLVYGVQASPSERPHSTINENTDPQAFTWEATTTPVEVPGFKPSSSLEFDSRDFDKGTMKALEDILYGTDGASGGNAGTDARLPMPSELILLLKSHGYGDAAESNPETNDASESKTEANGSTESNPEINGNTENSPETNGAE